MDKSILYLYRIIIKKIFKSKFLNCIIFDYEMYLKFFKVKNVKVLISFEFIIC